MWRSGIHVIADCHTKKLKSKQSVQFTFRRFLHLNIGGFFQHIINSPPLFQGQQIKPIKRYGRYQRICFSFVLFTYVVVVLDFQCYNGLVMQIFIIIVKKSTNF
jgi:hypothetical protein